MFRYIVAGFVFMCVFNIAAHAGEPSEPKAWKEPAGIGFGALIGGLVGGPPGAILGAAGGAWLGDRADRKDGEIAELEDRLAARNEEFGRLQAEFAALRKEQAGNLQRAALERRRSALDELTAGVSLDVFFRTGSAEPEPEFRARVKRLAAFLRDFPEIRLDIEGHADRRGTGKYNQRLSERRAAAVRALLAEAGLPAERMRIHAYGERQATAAEGDSEGYPWDRRVSISLSLDREA
jgi:outer membrane protein OmpA-like peptidoglycan-associated protein